MNILLTGGGGYIGSVLTGYLLKEKYKVTVIDNFKFDQNTLALHCNNKNLSIIKSDIRNLELLKKIVKDFDVVIPLAGLVGAPICKFNKSEAKSINLESNLALFKILEKKQLVIMPTTNSAYGKGKINEVFDEKSKLKPISQYANHKLIVEKQLMKNENAISLRLATVFGMSPRMRTDLLVNNFVYRAVKDKYIVLFESHYKRNYIHIRDVCRAFIHCIKNSKIMKKNIYNLGLEDTNISKKELCEIISKKTELNIFENNFIKDEDQRNYIVSNKKILKTGFKTKFSLEDGIDELIKGYKCIDEKSFRNF